MRIEGRAENQKLLKESSLSLCAEGTWELGLGQRAGSWWRMGSSVRWIKRGACTLLRFKKLISGTVLHVAVGKVGGSKSGCMKDASCVYSLAFSSLKISNLGYQRHITTQRDGRFCPWNLVMIWYMSGLRPKGKEMPSSRHPQEICGPLTLQWRMARLSVSHLAWQPNWISAIKSEDPSVLGQQTLILGWKRRKKCIKGLWGQS